MKFNRKDAEGLRDLKEKHGVTPVRTPDGVMTEHFKAWDKIAKEETPSGRIRRWWGRRGGS